MNRDIVFGQYYPGKSFVHRLDPRLKLFAVAVFIAGIFLCDSLCSYLFSYAFLLFVILVSRVPLSSILKTLRAVVFVIVLSLAINVFFYKDGTPLFEWKFLRATDEGLIYAAKMALRILFLVVSTSMLTLTTTPMSITDGMESVMRPLKALRFPVRDVAVIMSTALRFIPTLLDEVNKIIMAQKARGAHFDTGGPIKRAKALLPVLVPLFVSTFKRADELAMALDARCYDATPKRTKMKPLKFGAIDLIALLALAGYLTMAILLKLGFFGLISGPLAL